MLLICLDLYFTVVATRLQVFWDTFEMSYRTKKSDNKQGWGTKCLKKLIKCKRNKNRKNAKQLGGQAALLFRANIKLAEIQCKSLINRNLSSQVTLDGNFFMVKLHPGVPQVLTKFPSYARKPLESSKACFWVRSTLWLELSLTNHWKDIKTCDTPWNMHEWLYVSWNSQNQSLLHVPMHGKQPLKDTPFGKIHNQKQHFSLDSIATDTN